MAKRQVRLNDRRNFEQALAPFINQKATIVKTDRSAIFVTLLKCTATWLTVSLPHGREIDLAVTDVEEIILDISR